MTDKVQRSYIAIDLKSFFASVECVERRLNALTTNLVVADLSRTEKTICLAVSPSLKSYGIAGRARLFEVVQKVRDINATRAARSPRGRLIGKSVYDPELKSHPELALDYIVARPRMSKYIEYSTRVYNTYLKYVSADDIHVYSIDEVFMDVTEYLRIYKCSVHELAMTMIRDVLKTTGITATAGIGTNMYLAKIAMDIVAKHIPADAQGVRIAELDEMSYRQQLWSHRPLTSFWRVGKGTARRLESYGIFTMGDIARQSVLNDELLYKLFGVNAEILIDHAWGWEPCTIEMVKKYRPEVNSLSSGQVLSSAYSFDKARVVLLEMAQDRALSLLDKRLVTDQLVLDISYDTQSLTTSYRGPLALDHYGRSIPAPAHGSARLPFPTSSSRLISEAAAGLFDNIVSRDLLVRRLNLTACNIISEDQAPKPGPIELELFADNEALQRERDEQLSQLEKERKAQEAVLQIKKQFGKNAILRGLNFDEGATARERNSQIGGHKA